jgi:hypothetical protein
MESLITNLVDFEFNEITLDNPTPLQGGSFFTKIKVSNKCSPLYLQFPKCVSKNGIITSTNKRSYIDLQYNFFETDVVNWLEKLETKCRELIFEKRELWFETEMMEDDIETMFLNTYKPYNSGKFLILRTNIPTLKNMKQPGCLIYDENENFLEYESIKNNIAFIPLLHIEGIKFTAKSFKIEITIKQIMVLSLEEKIKKDCLIKHSTSKKPEPVPEPVLVQKPEPEPVPVQKPEPEPVPVAQEEEEEEEAEEVEEAEEAEEEEEEEEEEAESKLESLDNLQEYNLEIDEIDTNAISLKSPKDIYYEIYKAAYKKAEQFRKAALEAHLEAKNIKLKYNLDDLSITSEQNTLSDLSNFSDFE